MSIEHKNIPNANLHETKGINTAVLNTVHTANGAGSGTWAKVGSASLAALAGDGGSANKRIITNGTGGFTLQEDAAFGSMTITGNTNAFTVTAAADSSLNTNSDYVLFTGTGAPWAAGSPASGITFLTDRLTVPVTGVYRIDVWSTITSYPTNTAKISIKYRLNGTGGFSTRHPISKSNSAGDAGQLTGFGLLTLTAGDYLQLYVASSASGGLVFGDLNTTLELVKAT